MKRILIVHNEPFIPSLRGNTKAIWEYCNVLKKLGCELYYCVTSNCNLSQEFIDYFEGRVYVLRPKRYNRLFVRIIQYCTKKVYKKITGYNNIDDLYPYGLERFVEELHCRYSFDSCIVNYITLSRLFKYISVKQKILYAHDTFSFKRKLLGVDRFWFNLKPNEEAKGLDRCSDIVAIQYNEAVLFHYLNPLAKVYTVYSYFSPVELPVVASNSILYIAGNNEVNLNGITFFLQHVFPLILAIRTDVSLEIGGSICDVIPSSLITSHVHLLGKIDKLESFYALGNISINPVYQGTGLKIKTFEGLSYGKAVVAHSHSVEGIYNIDQAPILSSSDPKRMAEYILLLLDNRKLCISMHKHALAYIKEMNTYVLNEYRKLINEN